jgi:glycosyltransferase involved in cell wall biosynthesis
MASHAPLILSIADNDRERFRREWNCQQIEYLPMSIPGDGQPRVQGWLRDGLLRILHLGSVSHLPSYRSLEFLFEHVFPLMPVELLNRISMDVVGTVDSENQRTRRILALAKPYSNVTFHGFVDDVVPYYRKSDIQVVASTDATGLRTRTIESFAYGLPVLSTSVGARGIAGLRPGEQLLIADDPRAFVENLSRLLKSPELLSKLSRSGREFYEENQSRKAVALRLSDYLRQYFGITSDLVDNREIDTEIDRVPA